MKKLLFAFTLLAVSLAYGKSYHLVLFEKSMLGSAELKPGEYTLELKDQQAILKSGKTRVEAAVKIETESSKYASTSVRYANGDGRFRLREIHLGGTNMKVVFNE